MLNWWEKITGRRSAQTNSPLLRLNVDYEKDDSEQDVDNADHEVSDAQHRVPPPDPTRVAENDHFFAAE